MIRTPQLRSTVRWLRHHILFNVLELQQQEISRISFAKLFLLWHSKSFQNPRSSEAKSRENEIYRTKDTRANERPRNKDWSSSVSLPKTQSFLVAEVPRHWVKCGVLVTWLWVLLWPSSHLSIQICFLVLSYLTMHFCCGVLVTWL